MRRRFDWKIVVPAAGKMTTKSDFDCNRDGLYGSPPGMRDRAAPRPRPNASHSEPDVPAEEPPHELFGR